MEEYGGDENNNMCVAMGYKRRGVAEQEVRESRRRGGGAQCATRFILLHGTNYKLMAFRLFKLLVNRMPNLQ